MVLIRAHVRSTLMEVSIVMIMCECPWPTLWLDGVAGSRCELFLAPRPLHMFSLRLI